METTGSCRLLDTSSVKDKNRKKNISLMVKVRVGRTLVAGHVSPYLAQWVHLPLFLSIEKRMVVLHRDKWSESVVQCIVCSECEEMMVG